MIEQRVITYGWESAVYDSRSIKYEDGNPVQTNFVQNPSAEGSLVGLQPEGNGSVSIVSDAVTGTGSRAYKVVTAQTTFQGTNTPREVAPTVAGTPFRARARSRLDTGVIGARRMVGTLRFFSSAGVLTGSFDGPRVTITPQGTFRRWTGTAHGSTSEEFSGTKKRTNYVTNPGFETGTTGWANAGGGGGTVAQSTVAPLFGNFCALVATGTVDLSGAQINLTGVATGVDYTASAYVLAPAGYKFKLRLSNNTTLAVFTAAVGTGAYQRVSVTMPAASTTAAPSLQVVADGAGTATGLYVDGVMLEVGTSTGAYFDGSTVTPLTGKSRAWKGTAYASASIERSSDGSERTNYALDPFIGNGVDPGNAVILNIGSGQYTRSIISGASPSGGYAFRATANNASGSSAVGLGMFTPSLAPGRYVCSFWFRHSNSTAITAQPYIEGSATASNPTVLGTAFNPIPPNTWTRITYATTVSVPGTMKVGINVSVPTSGVTADYADWLVERSDASAAGSVFDGSSADPSLVLSTGNSQEVVELTASGTAPAGTAYAMFSTFRTPELGTESAVDTYYLDQVMLTDSGFAGVPPYFDGSFDQELIYVSVPRPDGITTDDWFEVDGVPLNTLAYNITTAGGGRLSPPDVRGANVTVPGRPGTVFMKKELDSQSINLSMWVQGVGANGLVPTDHTSQATFDHNWRTLRKLLFQTRRELTVTKRWEDWETGAIRSATGKAQFNGGLDPSMTGRARALFSVDLLMNDPFFYDTKHTLKSTGQTQKTWKVSLEGDWRTTALTVDIAGPRVNPRISITSDDTGLTTWVKYTGTIAAGEVLKLNINNFSAKLQSTSGALSSVIGNISHDGDKFWLLMEPGDNTVLLESTSGTSEVSIAYIPVWF